MDRRSHDPVDGQIIAELSRNARMSHAELGQRVMLSRNAVRQRIERLERQGVIQGYTLVQGTPEKNEAMASAILMVYRKDRMRGAEVLAALRLIPEVVICDVLSGDFDLFVRLEARSLERIREIWEEIAAHPGVTDTVTALTLSTVINRFPPPTGIPAT
ncbi:Lrp/AsnC family transcriptional regulator [Pseudarthrobacter sp. P1]|uniref:Lrp/AsnC family transcriptional regulator n=1 Tax=Pseudarthrobacter sp. P1 TaxID=3418418 RepID=UPI003CED96AD